MACLAACVQKRSQAGCEATTAAPPPPPPEPAPLPPPPVILAARYWRQSFEERALSRNTDFEIRVRGGGGDVVVVAVFAVVK